MIRQFGMLVYLLGLLITSSSLLHSKERVIFIHIPKTAGGSLDEMMKQNFPKNELPEREFYYFTLNPSSSDFTRQRLTCGHIFYSQIKDIPGKKITILREPIRRIISEHMWWAETYQKSPQFYLDHFLPPGDPLYTVQNHQCLFLSSYDPQDRTIPITKHLKSAKFNLANNFFFVGITEDFDGAVKTIFSSLGWPEPTTQPRKYPTRSSSVVLSKELQEQIRQRNWADIELYDYAKKLYFTKFKQDQVNR